ncbi:OsmC family protein [Taibaiella lutea]|uniref:OsmC family protein n=1 Tax=Taibaiella lutea TaxID=2608001 RepID=A0A5M6CMC1_9BACT|nr:OsmC family protein [Taibaiella lutea]KAA5536358.1 OsmC family protein [Taibaiella lutea]
MKRKASAVWNGTIMEGKGSISTQSTVLNNAQYSFKTRFADGVGTNPEELIAAAHAGCFTMQLSANIGEAGFTPESLETSCEVTFENGSVTKSHLTVHAKVDGLEQSKFDELVAHAEKNCPISKLLNTEISVDSSLN